MTTGPQGGQPQIPLYRGPSFPWAPRGITSCKSCVRFPRQAAQHASPSCAWPRPAPVCGWGSLSPVARPQGQGSEPGCAIEAAGVACCRTCQELPRLCLPRSRLPASGDEEGSGRGEKEGDRNTATVPPSCRDVCLEPFALSLPLQVAESRGEEFAPGKEHESLIRECLSHSTDRKSVV